VKSNKKGEDSSLVFTKHNYVLSVTCRYITHRSSFNVCHSHVLRSY